MGNKKKFEILFQFIEEKKTFFYAWYKICNKNTYETEIEFQNYFFINIVGN